MIEIARSSVNGEKIAVINISGALGISKIYLEQVLSQLKKAGILFAAKGSKGGYQLSRPPSKISVWEILSALESALVEPAEITVAENAPEIEAAMKQRVFLPLDSAVEGFLSKITVLDMLEHTERQHAEQAFMLNM